MIHTLDAVHHCGFDRRVTLDVQLPATITCPCGGEAVLLRPSSFDPFILEFEED